MARKGLRNAALLGGAALLAAKMMSGKDKESKASMAKDDMDTTGDASAGMAKDRLADFRTAAQEADDDAKIRAATRNFGRRSAAQEAMDDARIFGSNAPMEGRTASGLPREARGIGSVFDRSAPVAGRPRGGMKSGGSVKSYKSGGKVSSASKRADGIAVKGKTKGRMV
jgi:hypothetical protein